MKYFFLTFGQKYPWRNGWVLVQAKDYEKAREIVVEVFGERWSHLYTEGNFNPMYFPAGQIGETLT